MAITLGAAVNRALRTIGEPDITSFDSDNQLQNILIDAANEGVHDMLEAARHRWGLRRDAFTTTAVQDDGTVDVTNGSTTVTSQDDDGADADNFGSVTAGMWFRATADLTSYEVSSVSTGASPDTLTLADSYVGTTATTAGYRIIQDTYALSITDMDEILIAAYGDTGLAGNRLEIVDMRRLYNLSGGDLHRDTSGKPRYLAEVANDSSENPQVVLWPAPTSAYLIEVWHTTKFTSNTTFATNLFGGDAPDIAYDGVCHYLRHRACMYDEKPQEAMRWWEMYERARYQVTAREQRTHRDDTAMTVETYRRHNYGARRHVEVRSQIQFDTL